LALLIIIILVIIGKGQKLPEANNSSVNMIDNKPPDEELKPKDNSHLQELETQDNESSIPATIAYRNNGRIKVSVKYTKPKSGFLGGPQLPTGAALLPPRNPRDFEEINMEYYFEFDDDILMGKPANKPDEPGRAFTIECLNGNIVAFIGENQSEFKMSNNANPIEMWDNSKNRFIDFDNSIFISVIQNGQVEPFSITSTERENEIIKVKECTETDQPGKYLFTVEAFQIWQKCTASPYPPENAKYFKDGREAEKGEPGARAYLPYWTEVQEWKDGGYWWEKMTRTRNEIVNSGGVKVEEKIE
jgi:hypothetical protein